MAADSVCQRCGIAGPTRFVHQQQVIGLLVAVLSRGDRGLYCRRCADAAYGRAMAVNLTVGLLSVLSPLVVPPIVFGNVASHRRLRRQFDALAAASKTPTALRRLPWEPLIGVDMQGVNGKPLTPPMLAVALTYFALLVAVVWLVVVGVLSITGPLDRPPAMDPRTPEELRRTMADFHRQVGTLLLVVPALAVALVGTLGWGRRRTRPRGAAVDVLGELFPPATIFQAGRANFVLLGLQLGPWYRIVVAVQNRFDVATAFELSAAGMGPNPPLACDVPPSGIVLAWLDCALPAVEQVWDVRVRVRAGGRGRGGRRVLGVGRAILSSKSRDDAFALAQALAGGGGSVRLGRAAATGGGVQFLGPQSELRTRVEPTPGQDGADPAAWSASTLWTPDAVVPGDRVAASLVSALGGTL